MKKLLFASAMMLSLITFSSCTKGGDNENGDNDSSENTTTVDATSYTTWHYFAGGDKAATLVGTGESSEDATWAKRTDWDFAIQRYMVRTNGGASSSTNAKGGLYAFGKENKFADITASPASAKYVLDENSVGGMTPVATSKQSVARVLISSGMPPVYTPSPVYALKSADGTKVYALDLIAYKNAADVSGHVQFNLKTITDGGSSTTDAVSVDATSATDWKYFKAGNGTATLVGTGADAADATWAAKTDWDFAIQKNYIRTNSGTSTTANGAGGLYTFLNDVSNDDFVEYLDITKEQVPSTTVYVVDEMNSIGMSTPKQSSMQKVATVAVVAGGGMPPVYKGSPTYAIKSADGTKIYKIQFLSYASYLDPAKPTTGTFGQISFKIAELK